MYDCFKRVFHVLCGIGNGFTEKGAKAIGEGLGQNSSIRMLKISCMVLLLRVYSDNK